MKKTANGSGTVQFRGNPPRWFARVTGKDEHGNVVRPWVDLDRPDLKNTPGDKATAKRLAERRSKQARKAVYVGKTKAAAPRITLAEIEEKWFPLIEKDPDLKPATTSRYKSSWNGIVAKLGRRPVVELTPPVLHAWVLEQRETKSVSTVRNDVNALTRAFKDAIAQRWVPLTFNPMKDDYVRAAVPSMQAPELDEIVQWSRTGAQTLLASPLTDLDFGMVLVSVTTGLRLGELQGLRFGDDGTDEKHPDVRRLQVLRQALEPRDGKAVEIGPLKSQSSRRRSPCTHPRRRGWTGGRPRGGRSTWVASPRRTTTCSATRRARSGVRGPSG